MTSQTTRVELDAVCFERDERTVLARGDLRVSSFRYRSGVVALRIRNRDGEAVVLPYHGQQIWDATYHGRRLTMGSGFDEPLNERAFRRNYGAFLVHCGAHTMGTPGPEDRHLPHGELPHAPMDAAWLEVGADAEGAFVDVLARHDEREAFTVGYRFEPKLRFREAGGRIVLSLTVTNLRPQPMELMYLAHVNFRPVDGARMVDATPDIPERVRIRSNIEGMAENPAELRTIVPGRELQVLAAMDAVADTEGWSHALQVLPDGSADFISHRPDELDHAIRWMVRNGVEDALGLVLPATAEADGRAAELAKGNIKVLAPGATFACTVRFGALTAVEAAEMAGRIEALRARSSRQEPFPRAEIAAGSRVSQAKDFARLDHPGQTR